MATKQKDCEEDLKKAEPALVAAQQALNTLNKVIQWFWRAKNITLIMIFD